MNPAPRPDTAAGVCPRCGGIVACGYLAGVGDCWCGALPRLPRDKLAAPAHCLCPACLQEALAAAGVDVAPPAD